jgi:iron-sulfur cluster assembly protein
MALTLTTSAADRVRELNAKENRPERWMRIGIRGGGCSGLQYFLDFVDTPKEGDREFEFGPGVRVCVDKKSYLFLNGTEVDFERGLLKTGFVFHNPMAQRSCSCGESFSV